MLKKANISWSSNQIVKMIGKGNIKFDNMYQRKYVWDNKRKSLFIDSLIEGYPVPPVYARKLDGVYDMLDGLQRFNCVGEYKSDGFALGVLPDVIDEDTNEAIEISGKKFSELPESIQENINSYMFTVYYFDSITDEEVKELFYRLNNNLPLTTFELIRTKALSFNRFKEMAKHDVFNYVLGKKELSHSVDEDMIMKMWIMIKDDEPCLDKKDVEAVVANEEISSDMKDTIIKINDYMMGVYDNLSEREDENIKKIIKKCFTKTQYLSLSPVVRDIINEDINISMDEFCNWICRFFDTSDSEVKMTSISSLYNENSKGGTAHSTQTKNRIEAIRNDINDFFKFH